MAVETVKLNVEGMSCQHCVNSIKKAVGELSGVNEVEVDLDKKTVTVKYNPTVFTISKIIETIEDQGYEVKK